MRLFSKCALGFVACVGAVLPIAGAPTAQAHDVILRSSPGDGQTVAEFPREIRLEFSGIPQDSFNTVAVSDAATQTVLFSAQPTADAQILSVAVPEQVHPGPGEYVVGFQITSSDGHATRGKIGFTVEGATDASSAQAQPSAGAADIQTKSSQRNLLVVLGVVAIAVFGIAALMMMLMRKRK